MASATLKGFVKTANGAKEVSTAATITHNNLRLYYHTDGETYYYTGDDASGNRIYRNARKVN